MGAFLVRERAALSDEAVAAAGLLLAVAGSWLLVRGAWVERGLLLAALLATTLAPVALYRVEGDSMHPTLVQGDILLAVRLVDALHRGDVLVLESPEWQGVFLVKRLTGVPGDWISLGQLVQAGQRAAPAPRRLDAGRYMVLGDNAAHSRDGRHFGPIPLRLVVARVLVRLTPWPRFVRGGAQPHLHAPRGMTYR